MGGKTAEKRIDRAVKVYFKFVQVFGELKGGEVEEFLDLSGALNFGFRGRRVR